MNHMTKKMALANVFLLFQCRPSDLTSVWGTPVQRWTHLNLQSPSGMSGSSSLILPGLQSQPPTPSVDVVFYTLYSEMKLMWQLFLLLIHNDTVETIQIMHSVYRVNCEVKDTGYSAANSRYSSGKKIQVDFLCALLAYLYFDATNYTVHYIYSNSYFTLNTWWSYKTW